MYRIKARVSSNQPPKKLLMVVKMAKTNEETKIIIAIIIERTARVAMTDKEAGKLPMDRVTVAIASEETSVVSSVMPIHL